MNWCSSFAELQSLQRTTRTATVVWVPSHTDDLPYTQYTSAHAHTHRTPAETSLAFLGSCTAASQQPSTGSEGEMAQRGRYQRQSGTDTAAGRKSLLPTLHSMFLRTVLGVIVLGCLSYISISTTFSLPLHHHHSRSNLYYSVYSYISINHVSLFSFTQYHHFRLNNFRIYFMYNKFEKIII
jgi:hypothetical protein